MVSSKRRCTTPFHQLPAFPYVLCNLEPLLLSLLAYQRRALHRRTFDADEDPNGDQHHAADLGDGAADVVFRAPLPVGAGRGRADTGARLSVEGRERAIRLIADYVGEVVTRDDPRLAGVLPATGERFQGLLPPVSPAPPLSFRHLPTR